MRGVKVLRKIHLGLSENEIIIFRHIQKNRGRKSLIIFALAFNWRLGNVKRKFSVRKKTRQLS